MSYPPRPLGILFGSAGATAKDSKWALSLAGGPLVFTLVEVDGRHVVPACNERETLAPQMAPRPPFAGLPMDGPVVMGVVNVTPDSFSDGGAFLNPARAIAHAEALIEAGARIVDIGGESTRPGATPVDPAEEIDRVIPVIEGALPAATLAGAVISIDTRNAATATAAYRAGARILNDVSALTHDRGMLRAVAPTDMAIILMHMQGEPATMQDAPTYENVALEVYRYLQKRIAACEKLGIDRSRLAVDPGIGFGKTVEHNLALLDRLSLFHGLGVPLAVGVSRKGFLARLSAGEPVHERLGGSLAAGLAAINQGAQIVRAHDVAETVQALRFVTALRNNRL